MAVGGVLRSFSSLSTGYTIVDPPPLAATFHRLLSQDDRHVDTGTTREESVDRDRDQQGYDHPAGRFACPRPEGLLFLLLLCLGPSILASKGRKNDVSR